MTSDDHYSSEVFREVVETTSQPFLIVGEDLTVQLCNRAFLSTFDVSRSETDGRFLYDIGNGQWNIPELRRLLQQITAGGSSVEDYRVEHTFETIGRRVMMLNARLIEGAEGKRRILLAISDVTRPEQLQWELEGAKQLADKIIDASRDALLILGWDLRVKSANLTFYNTFKINPA